MNEHGLKLGEHQLSKDHSITMKTIFSLQSLSKKIATQVQAISYSDNCNLRCTRITVNCDDWHDTFAI
jgi:hypothetical protein